VLIGAALLPFCVFLGEEIQDFLIVVALVIQSVLYY